MKYPYASAFVIVTLLTLVLVAVVALATGWPSSAPKSTGFDPNSTSVTLAPPTTGLRP